MKLGVLIVENRYSREGLQQIIERHTKYLPKCEVVHYSPQIKNLSDYNEFMTSQALWNDLLHYDRVLVIQHDSEILREGIEEFYDYDFIGAPLFHIGFPRMNGGLSLRNPRRMQEAAKLNYQEHVHGNEDIYFVDYLNHKGGILPDYEAAKNFSVETIFTKGTFGAHAIDRWLSPEQCKEIRGE